MRKESSPAQRLNKVKDCIDLCEAFDKDDLTDLFYSLIEHSRKDVEAHDIIRSCYRAMPDAIRGIFN